ncbi:MAG: Tad domain-containing protein [Rhizobiaceae bacterium]
MKQIISRFGQCGLGSVAAAVGVMAVPLIMACGIAVDYSSLVRMRYALQDVADAAALSTVKDPALATTTNDAILEIASNHVDASLTKDLELNRTKDALRIETEVSDSRKAVTVSLAYTWKPLIIHYLYKPSLPIEVSASASLAGNEQICVIALDNKSPGSFTMTGKSSLTARGCAVYSNSTSPSGISLVKGADLNTSNTYTAGGYDGPTSSYRPLPIVDAPVIEDPLNDRESPDSSVCDHTNLKFKEDFIRLKPGVYCGGIIIKKTAHLKLKPGTYVMKDGPLIVKGDSTLIGKNVGFYFTGDNATFDFGPSTQVKLTAPKTGPLTGLLFFQDQNAPDGYEFMIRSRDAMKFEGTVYLPNGKFIVDNKSRIGKLSKWTAIVAKQIEIMRGPELVLRADYAASDIPFPEGSGPNGEVRLTK